MTFIFIGIASLHELWSQGGGGWCWFSSVECRPTMFDFPRPSTHAEAELSSKKLDSSKFFIFYNFTLFIYFILFYFIYLFIYFFLGGELLFCFIMPQYCKLVFKNLFYFDLKLFLLGVVCLFVFGACSDSKLFGKLIFLYWREMWSLFPTKRVIQIPKWILCFSIASNFRKQC